MTTLVHVGEMVTGRITATIPVVDMSWTDVLNDSGTVDATVTGDVVREFDLRQKTHGGRSFLAVEVDGRIKQAGPIWGRRWDWRNQRLSLGASGLWSWFDKRIVYPLPWGDPIQTSKLTLAGKSLGGIARGLASTCATQWGSLAPSPPIVLPPDEAGDHTETFEMWKLLRYGEQLRQITQRATDAPDIRFQARRRGDDPRYIEWVMQVGTEDRPALYQEGPDWIFDSSAPKSPVHGITTDEDASEMAELVWTTGNGQEEDILLASTADFALINLGWPLTEATKSFPTVEQRPTLDGHTQNFLRQVARPIEVLKVTASVSTYNEILPGDYARTITRGDTWLGDMDLTTRIKQVSGDLSDELKFDVFSIQAAL